MLRQTIRILTCLLISLSVSTVFCSAYALDLEKEKRMKEQIIDYIMDGDAVLLKDGSHEFLTIYMPSETQPARGSIVVMHGRGHHPNWPELVYPLRTGLPEHGWNTLSIQMPVLDNDASSYDYMDILPESHPRINAAIEYLRQRSEKNIILLAHSCSVHMAIDWLHKNPHEGISAFIGIGMGPTDTGQPMLKPFPLEQIPIPILDIRGQYDYPAVIRNAPRRLRRIKQAGNKKSQQRVIAKANHYFTDHSDVLLAEITGWLDFVFSQEQKD